MRSSSIFVLLFLTAFCSNGQTIYDGYTDKLSYNPGEAITFYLSASGSATSLGVYSIGGFGTSFVVGPLTLTTQTITTTHPWEDGYGFSPTVTCTVPTNLNSGYYFLNHQVPFIVKSANKNVDIVVVIPTNTDEAYNIAGGPVNTNSNGGLYYYTVPGVPGSGITAVSILRPYTTQGLFQGFAKWITNWASAKGYSVSFISDMDMDDYTEIENAKVLIITGHSEYWTRQARLNFDKFVDAGKDALILSGNTMWWQVRYSTDKTQIFCYRGANWDNSYFDDPIISTDPLLATYHWCEPTLKYSTLGSIGSDFLRSSVGVDGGSSDLCYGGFNGYKIIMPQSPLFQGINENSIPPFSYHDTLQFATNEYDGTLVKRDASGNALDASGNIITSDSQDPVLDVSALSLYRAEMIGYDKIVNNIFNPTYPNIIEYAPFMVFQKTCTSGTIINVNSNEWCAPWGIGLTGTNPNGEPSCSQSTVTADGRLPIITANMIELLIQDQNSNTIGINNGDNLFYNPRPTSPAFKLNPTYTNVSYNACSGGLIDITPCGVYLTQGYKVDNGYTFTHTLSNGPGVGDVNPNLFSASIDNTCTNYNNGLAPIKPSPKGDTNSTLKNNSFSNVTVFPNPSNGVFTIQEQGASGKEQVEVYNTLGERVQTLNIQNSTFKIDLSGKPTGVYLYRITTEKGELLNTGKLVIN